MSFSYMTIVNCRRTPHCLGKRWKFSDRNSKEEKNAREKFGTKETKIPRERGKNLKLKKKNRGKVFIQKPFLYKNQWISLGIKYIQNLKGKVENHLSFFFQDTWKGPTLVSERESFHCLISVIHLLIFFFSFSFLFLFNTSDWLTESTQSLP